jgi:hypothetical protein
VIRFMRCYAGGILDFWVYPEGVCQLYGIGTAHFRRGESNPCTSIARKVAKIFLFRAVHPLYQRLKELDSDTFERLCFHLVKARFPGAEIRHVNGAAGDGGLDLFSGQLDAGPTIWQCKSFPGGVGKHQKDQIRASLKRALDHRPRRWVLCLSVDIDAGAHRWFERLQRSYAGRLDVRLMQACDIVQELFCRSTIREMFFPHAVPDLSAFLEMVTKTKRLSTKELSTLNAGNLDQYLKRLEDEDARFSYEVRYRRNFPPVADQPQPGQIASISDGTKTIDVFTRDVEALKLNPPKARFTVIGQGVDKMKELLRSGTAQVIGPGELQDYATDFAFLLPSEDQVEGTTLFIGPATAALPSLLTRVTFGSGRDAVVYECITFKATRVGREEAEFESSNTLPFRMSLIVRISGTGCVHFERRWAGVDVHTAQKFTNALKAAYGSGVLELYDLERAVTLLKPRLTGELPAWFSGYDEFINDAVRVADFYKLDLRMPEQPTRGDLESISLLVHLIDGDLRVEVNDMTFTMTKTADIGEAQAESFRGEGSYLLTLPEYFVRPVLFGVQVFTGPVAYHIPRARFEGPDEVCRFFQTAPIGEDITVKLKPIGPVRARAIRPQGAEAPCLS